MASWAGIAVVSVYLTCIGRANVMNHSLHCQACKVEQKSQVVFPLSSYMSNVAGSMTRLSLVNFFYRNGIANWPLSLIF